MDDLKLFNGIVSDLFPKIQDVPVDYGEMEESIRKRALEKGLEDVQGSGPPRLIWTPWNVAPPQSGSSTGHPKVWPD